MTSFKCDTAASRTKSLLHEWDSGSTSVRRSILQDFVAQNQRKTAPELEAQFADVASLLLTRFTSWLRLTYMIGTCLTEQLQALQVFIAASGGEQFLEEFLEVGGALTVMEILSVKQAKETDKAEALKLLVCLASAGRQYKEFICEAYGVRSAVECLARSRLEETQQCACRLLRTLAEGNPRFQTQVYHGLISLLSCSSAVAQHMAAQSLRIVQPIIGTAHTTIIDQVLNLLKTLHVEVQFEALELIELLMEYEVKNAILEGLVSLLRPTVDVVRQQMDIFNDSAVERMSQSLPVYVQQAAAAKCIGLLVRMSSDTADELLALPVASNLMYAMGNVDYSDSQRHAAMTLQYLCQTYRDVDEKVHNAMGDTLYERFMADPETLYMKMDDIQIDIFKCNNIH